LAKAVWNRFAPKISALHAIFVKMCGKRRRQRLPNVRVVSCIIARKKVPCSDVLVTRIKRAPEYEFLRKVLIQSYFVKLKQILATSRVVDSHVEKGL
jgi:hypothetical protein